jgi:hypothetical protein
MKKSLVVLVSVMFLALVIAATAGFPGDEACRMNPCSRDLDPIGSDVASWPTAIRLDVADDPARRRPAETMARGSPQADPGR